MGEGEGVYMYDGIYIGVGGMKVWVIAGEGGICIRGQGGVNESLCDS